MTKEVCVVWYAGQERFGVIQDGMLIFFTGNKKVTINPLTKEVFVFNSYLKDVGPELGTIEQKNIETNGKTWKIPTIYLAP